MSASSAHIYINKDKGEGVRDGRAEAEAEVGPLRLSRMVRVAPLLGALEKGEQEGATKSSRFSRTVRIALLMFLFDWFGESETVVLDEDLVLSASNRCGVMDDTIRKHMKILCSKDGPLQLNGSFDVQVLCWKGEGVELR